jgi:hypothetical protein
MFWELFNDSLDGINPPNTHTCIKNLRAGWGVLNAIKPKIIRTHVIPEFDGCIA